MTCKDCMHYRVCDIHYSQNAERCHHFEKAIVRCKDCEYRDTDDCAMFYTCDECGSQHSWERDDSFCSYGKRKDDKR